MYAPPSQQQHSQMIQQEDDIFEWLMGDCQDEMTGTFGDGYSQPQQQPQQSHIQSGDAGLLNNDSLDWAGGILPVADSRWNTYSLTDDLDGALDILMSGNNGAQTTSQVNAMQDFASEAASGVRRRVDSSYYQNQDVMNKMYDTQPVGGTDNWYYSNLSSPGDVLDDQQMESSPSTNTPGKVMSPKAKLQREKNREAVRQCRKRKREYAEQMQTREFQLQQENESLQMQLKLGTEESEREQTEECLKEVRKLQELLDTKGSQKSIKTVIEQYLRLNQQQATNREQAAKHIISRIIRQVEPSHATKMYLWQMSHDDKYFNSQGGLWEQLVTELQITEEQSAKLKERRTSTLSIYNEIASILKKLEFIHNMIVERSPAKHNIRLVDQICGSFDSQKCAHFLTRINASENVQNMDMDFDHMLVTLDSEVDDEHVDRLGDWTVHNPTSESVFTLRRTAFEISDTDTGEEALSRRRHLSCRVLRECFMHAPEKLEEFIPLAFDDDLKLYDPNTPKGTIIKGLAGLYRYTRRIRLSFTDLNATEDSFMTRKNVGRGCWTVHGTYYGSKRKNLPDSEREKIEQESKIAKYAPVEGRPVSFKVVAALQFAPDSPKIQQIIVSWGALELMRQFGFFGPVVPPAQEPVDNTSTSAKSKETDPLPKTPLTTKQKQNMGMEVLKIFETDDVDKRLEIATEFFDDNCISRDSNMGGVAYDHNGLLDYVRRLRRPFSSLKFSKCHFLDPRKPLGRSSSNLTEDEIGNSDANENDAVLHLSCTVNAQYTGALTSEPKPCEFLVSVFIVFNSRTQKISELEMSWNSASLMQQLGVLR